MELMSEKKKRSKKRTVLRVLAAVLLVAGIGVIVYPYALQYRYNRQANEDYSHFIERLPDRPTHEGAAADMPYLDLYRQMQAYNDELYSSGQSKLIDPWAYEQTSFNLTEYGFEEDVIGYIKIPKIDVVLPIYLGASEKNMKKGAVHLSQTSLPIGGENTNCVIAGHRGYYGATLFKNLVELEAGDEVTVTNLWYTMTYRVIDTTIIQAYEVDQLKIQPGRDMLSLFTCYFRPDRTDRFVAYCERVE